LLILPTDCKILILGLDNAGKTALTLRMHLGEVVSTMPTIGFNVETVEYKNISFTMWDVGGQDIIRPLWRYYYQGIDGLIFVIDSADERRITGPIPDSESKAASEELKHLVDQDDLRGVPILIFANKQDMAQAVPVAEMEKKLQLAKMLRGREWFMQGCSARTGQGVYEGMDWFTRVINNSAK
jgi:small GTP-binding protein